MKMFFLRELSFLLVPFLLLTSIMGIVTRAFSIAAVVGFSLIFSWAAYIFAVQPLWFEWVGIVVLLFLSFLAAMGILGASANRK